MKNKKTRRIFGSGAAQAVRGFSTQDDTCPVILRDCRELVRLFCSPDILPLLFPAGDCQAAAGGYQQIGQ